MGNTSTTADQLLHRRCVALADVRFAAHNGLLWDIAACPKSANNGEECSRALFGHRREGAVEFVGTSGL